MNRPPRIHRNLWALVVLGLLRERPMHPYEMQRLIRERGKGDLLDLKRGSLYHAVERLERAGMIEPVETSREGRRPERTVYRATEAGVDQLVEWVREMVGRPTRDTNEFIAAIAHLPHLSPADAADLLETRAAFLQAEIASLDSVLETLTPRLGPLVLLESDLSRALKRAEREWVLRLVQDLRRGVHRWNPEEILGAPDVWPGMPREEGPP